MEPIQYVTDHLKTAFQPAVSNGRLNHHPCARMQGQACLALILHFSALESASMNLVLVAAALVECIDCQHCPEQSRGCSIGDVYQTSVIVTTSAQQISEFESIDCVDRCV